MVEAAQQALALLDRHPHLAVVKRSKLRAALKPFEDPQ